MTNDQKINHFIMEIKTMPDPKTPLDITSTLKNLGDEIKRLNDKIEEIKTHIPKDDLPSEACLIMVMQLEVATLFMNKLFESGLFDSINLDKNGFIYRPQK